MKADTDALARHLQSSLKPAYIISGDEHLLVQEASQLIREAATQAGHSERLIFTVDTDADWLSLRDATHTLSLFASQRILDVRVPSAKLSESGKKLLIEYAKHPPATDILLLILPKLEKRVLSGAWFKALDGIAMHVPIWPIPRAQFPRWIDQRLKKLGLTADREAVMLLADLLDGNLLAAAQEIEKLKLIHGVSTLSADVIRDSVGDSSRYNVFALIDTTLKGDAKTACKMLIGLRNEGSEPLSVLWALTREVRLLSQISGAIDHGVPAGKAMQQAHVWQSRQRLINAALDRLSLRAIEKLLLELAQVDLILKGARDGNGWDQMERVLIKLAGITRTRAATSA